MKTDNSRDAVDAPAGLEARLEALIDRLAGEERRAAARTRGKCLRVSIAAAGAVILLAAGIYPGGAGDTGAPPPCRENRNWPACKREKRWRWSRGT